MSHKCPTEPQAPGAESIGPSGPGFTPGSGASYGTPSPATPADIAAQMVAKNLSKLSKEYKLSIKLSGKKEETRAWLFVFDNKFNVKQK